ncbi:MAG: sigma-70 family RNA polymerase sigma factor [Dokdonella sp.]|uniref:sigma-70 family RNA polymerase sigma factor n=1 Tax=Dokdonella sp. TaxID=2291710 RepID=UPI003263C4DC
MSADITQWLSAWRDGDADAGNRLVGVLYPQLRGLAAQLFRNERRNHTLQPTALVNEAWLRLAGTQALAAADRSHLFALAARVMREILIDHARARARLKRDGGERVTLSGIDVEAPSDETDLVDLDAALERLERIDPAKARVVELRYFGGLSIEETADAMASSPATVKRHWQAARIWLIDAMARQDSGELRDS